VVLVLSPHLDDGVLSCGQLLAAHPGSTLVTALAGIPPADAPLGSWDARTGFTSSYGAILARRAEDAEACELLSATPVWLDGLDGGQYARPSYHDYALYAQLLDVLRGCRDFELFLPLGVGHRDHTKVARLARAAASSLGIRFLCYEELPYRVLSPDAFAKAMTAARREGWMLEPLSLELGPLEAKEAAIDCYRSQITEYPRSSMLAEEGYLHVERRGRRSYRSGRRTRRDET
jgi:LmbE family N-acetylglucosaminyl deacetylase